MRSSTPNEASRTGSQHALPPEPRPAPPERNYLASVFRRLAQAVGLRGPQGDGSPPDLAQLRDWSREAIAKQGKVAGLKAVAQVADAYAAMDAADRGAYLDLLATEFAADAGRIEAAARAYLDGDPDREAALIHLDQALDSPRAELFRQFNTIREGIKFLVDLRADVLAREAEAPHLATMAYELRRLLRSWFNLGFLELTRISWESPANLLEKLVQYEAVHQIASWQDLKSRLTADRCCYAFVHPAMPDEPIIFVEVALVEGLADSVQELLRTDRKPLPPERADTAIFYSISNAQVGLRGIPFGNLLIKQVVARLRSELPTLETFATLSPVPRFRSAYLDAALEDGRIDGCFKNGEAQRLTALTGLDGVGPAGSALLARQNWHQDPEVSEALRPGLLRALRHYLLEERYKGHAACPVGHFHSSNGALLARLNWLADTSPQGLAQSAGMMVNYRYDMDRFEDVQETYEASGQITAAREVTSGP